MYNFGKLLGLTILSIAAIAIFSGHKAFAADCDMLVPGASGSVAANCIKYVNQANTSGVSSAGGLISALNGDLSSGVPADVTSAQWIVSQISPDGSMAGLQQALAQSDVTTTVTTLGNVTQPCNDSGYNYTTNSVDRLFQCDPSSDSVLQIVQNGRQILALRRLCGNAIGGTARLTVNHPPTGSFASISCNPSTEQYTIRFSYGDQDGATTAEIQSPGGKVLWGPSGGTGATWVVSTNSLVIADFPISLWVKDVGPGASNTYKKLASTSYANCNPVGSINAASSCYQVTFKLWDPNNPTGNINYRLSVNGAANQGTFSGGQNGATVTRDVSGLTGFTYWGRNTIQLIGVDNQTGGQATLGTATLTQICGSVACGISTMPGRVIAGEQIQFQVTMNLHSIAPTLPPNGPPGATFTTINFDASSSKNVGYTDSGGVLYSNKVTLTPQTAGYYTVTWTFGGGSSNPSTLSCNAATPTEVAYEQYFTVQGGDVSAGPGYTYSGSCVPDKAATITGYNLDSGATPRNFFGSNTDHAALATSSISGFATNAVNNIAANSSGSADGISGDAPSGLAFANTGSSGTTYGGSILGASSQSWCVPDYASTVTGSTGTSLPTNAALDSLAANQTGYVYRISGDLTSLGGFTLPAGVHVTVIVSGDVYINNDIQYGGYSSFQTVPQFSVMTIGGGSIYIAPNVKTLQGFYDAEPTSSGAGGVIYTCGSYSGGAFAAIKNYGTCDQNTLTIYGAVSSKQFVPGRTTGNVATTSSITDSPGEQIIYTPELWLGSVSSPNTSCATDPAQASCTYQSYTSLPPVL